MLPLETGNSYKNVLKTLRFPDHLAVTGPRFLAGEFHEFRRDNPSTEGSGSKHFDR